MSLEEQAEILSTPWDTEGEDGRIQVNSAWHEPMISEEGGSSVSSMWSQTERDRLLRLPGQQIAFQSARQSMAKSCDTLESSSASKLEVPCDVVQTQSSSVFGSDVPDQEATGSSRAVLQPKQPPTCSVSEECLQSEEGDFAEASRMHMLMAPLTIDIIMQVFRQLEDEVLVMCISVSKQWNHIASLRKLWQTRKKVRIEDGRVKWAAFQCIRVLRQKAHSTVVQCRSRTTGEMMVVKRVCLRVNASTGEAHLPEQDQGLPVRYLREVSLLRACNHPNVIKMLLVSYQDGSLDLFSEFVGQNVEDYIAGLPEKSFCKGTPEHMQAIRDCREMMRQVLGAVSYCHTFGILLRDIKPRNVMLQEGSSVHVKLTGFALGRFAPLPTEPLTREVVTLSYRAPELLLGGQRPSYSAPVDMWSAGCTLAEIASGLTLFEGESEIGLLFRIFRQLGTPTESTWPGVTKLPDFLEEPPQWLPKDLSDVVPLCPAGLDLLAQMLRYNPDERITAKAALEHAFFTGQPFEMQVDQHHESIEDQQPAKMSQNDANNYANDRRRALLSLEGAHLPAEDYKTFHKLRGFPAMRKILVEWLVEVVEEAHMKCETLFLAVNYMDRFLSFKEVQRERLQLVGVTCILVASKHEELAPQSVQNLIMMTDNTYKCGELLSMEQVLLHTLEYSIVAFTSLRALELLRSYIEQSDKYPPEGTMQNTRLVREVWPLAAFILELALAEYAECGTRPSELTAAAALLAVHIYEAYEASNWYEYAEHNPTGVAGPAFCAMAECVWESFGDVLDDGGDMKIGMALVGAGMRRLQRYFSSVQSQFATCRKYSVPERLQVSLHRHYPAVLLPTQAHILGVDVRLFDS